MWGGGFIFSEGKNPKKTTCKTQAGLALSGGTICYNQGLVAAFANCTLNSSLFPHFFMDFLWSLPISVSLNTHRFIGSRSKTYRDLLGAQTHFMS